MGLANGFKTAKLKYGHRGANHPVKDLKQDRVHITSQNHGYYIVEESIDKKDPFASFNEFNTNPFIKDNFNKKDPITSINEFNNIPFNKEEVVKEKDEAPKEETKPINNENKPIINIDSESKIIDDNVISDDEFFDDFFGDDDE